MSDAPQAFANAFLALVERKAKDQGLTHSALARAAFPDAQDPVGRWRKIRNHGQNLTVVDAWRLARAVGEDLAELVFQAGGGTTQAAVKPGG